MNSRIKIFLIAVLIISALALIGSRSANPYDEALFGLKRVQEKVFLKLKSDPVDRVNYLSALLDERLEEFENVIENKNHIWDSSLRYSTFAGQITNLITENNLRSKLPEIRKQFEEHKAKLYEMYVIYPKNTGDGEYKYIEDAINYLNAYLEKLASVR